MVLNAKSLLGAFGALSALRQWGLFKRLGVHIHIYTQVHILRSTYRCFRNYSSLGSWAQGQHWPTILQPTKTPLKWPVLIAINES